jgi:hypothetical protein
MAEDTSAETSTETDETLDEADRLDREEELKRLASSKDAPSKDSEEEPEEDDLDEEEPDEEDDPDDDEEEKSAKPEPEKKADAKPDDKKPSEKAKDAKAGQVGEEKANAEGGKEEKKPAEPTKLLKVRIDDEEYDLPEKVYEKVKGRIDQAEALRGEYRKAVRAIIDDFPSAVLDILTSAYGGDREKAYQHFLAEAKAVGDAQTAYEGLDPAARARLDAEHRATRAETELARIRGESQRQEEQTAKVKAAERALGEITSHMKALQIPVEKELAFAVLQAAEQLENEGKEFDLRELLREIHGDHQKDSTERDKRAEKRIVDLSDDEIHERYPELVEKVRRADLARLKRERSTAKTPRNGAERETVPPRSHKSKQEQRESYWTRW